MAKKNEFPAEKVVAALNEMGYNQLDKETSTALLADPAKCRELVGKVQGEDSVKRSDPVYMERYRKRAERMVEQAATVQKEESSSVEAVDTSVPETAAVAAPVINQTTDGAAAPVEQKEKKTMAKNAKVAKSAPKKAPKAKAPKVQKEKKPGVIDTIVTVLQSGKNTASAIAEKVAKKFPDRDPEGIAATVKIQVTRLAKAEGEGGRGLKIKREKQEGTNELIYYI